MLHSFINTEKGISLGMPWSLTSETKGSNFFFFLDGTNLKHEKFINPQINPAIFPIWIQKKKKKTLQVSAILLSLSRLCSLSIVY